MPRPLFIPNFDFEDEYLASDDAVALMADRAERVADAARDNAPERLREYKGSIRSWAGVLDGVATGRAIADDFKAHWIEFGTGHPFPTPAFAPLRTALQAIIGNIGGD